MGQSEFDGLIGLLARASAILPLGRGYDPNRAEV